MNTTFVDILQAVVNVSCCIREVQQSEQIKLWQCLEVVWKTALGRKKNKAGTFVYNNEHTKWLLMSRPLDSFQKDTSQWRDYQNSTSRSENSMQIWPHWSRKGSSSVFSSWKRWISYWIFIILAKIDFIFNPKVRDWTWTLLNADCYPISQANFFLILSHTLQTPWFQRNISKDLIDPKFQNCGIRNPNKRSYYFED